MISPIYVVFSDLHISNRNSKFKKDEQGISELLKLQRNFVEDVVSHAESYPDRDVCVLFLGDWTDYETLDPITQFYSNQMLAMLESYKFKTIMLEGNHCITDRGLKATVLTAFKPLSEDIDLVVQPEKIRVADGHYVFAVPYLSDDEQFEEAVRRFNEEAKDCETSILCFHQPLVNALLDNGLKSPSGMSLTEDMVNNFTLVLGGDFHTHQEVIPKAYYCGAPFQLKFGETTDHRGFWHIQLEEGHYTMVHHENKWNIPILDMTLEEALGADEQEAIVRVLGKPGFRERIRLKKKFYSVSYRHPPEKRVEGEFYTLEINSVEKDDSSLIKQAAKTVAPSLPEEDIELLLELFEDCRGE